MFPPATSTRPSSITVPVAFNLGVRMSAALVHPASGLQTSATVSASVFGPLPPASRIRPSLRLATVAEILGTDGGLPADQTPLFGSKTSIPKTASPQLPPTR